MNKITCSYINILNEELNCTHEAIIFCIAKYDYLTNYEEYCELKAFCKKHYYRSAGDNMKEISEEKYNKLIILNG